MKQENVMRLNLACPVDQTQLSLAPDGTLACSHGHVYPVIDGVPVLLRRDGDVTIGTARASIGRAYGTPGVADERAPELYLESLGISEAEKLMVLDLASRPASKIDPVASCLIAATNGVAYIHLVGKIAEYPIPEIRLPEGGGETLLDIGCSWGRWSIAAARKGYRVTGIDPSLGALVAAKRVSRSMGLSIDFICADARHLPFAEASFDKVYSYSVLQHFSRPDARRAFGELSRVLRPGGLSLVQMPNFSGIRSFTNLARRGFSEGADFDVRYWSLPELKRTFTQIVGPTRASIHCFFGLGLEPADRRAMRPLVRILLRLSETLRKLGTRIPALIYVADSVYLVSEKSGAGMGRA